MRDYRKLPIVLGTNPRTRRLNGDDFGYRGVPIDSRALGSPDPLVLVSTVKTMPVYAVGAVPGLCGCYGQGIGGPSRVLVRAPILPQLERLDQTLRSYNRSLVVVDGFRPASVQARLWRYIRENIIRNRDLSPDQLAVRDQLSIGMAADEIGSYCAALRDEVFLEELAFLSKTEEVGQIAKDTNETPSEVAELLLTFDANLGLRGLQIDPDATTAHGSGGAVDLWMIYEDGRYVNLGVPFDYVAPPGVELSPARMDYFDHPDVTVEVYAEAVARDPVLKQYLRELGYNQVTAEVFREAQENRRTLYNAVTNPDTHPDTHPVTRIPPTP